MECGAASLPEVSDDSRLAHSFMCLKRKWEQNTTCLTLRTSPGLLCKQQQPYPGDCQVKLASSGERVGGTELCLQR